MLSWSYELNNASCTLRDHSMLIPIGKQAQYPDLNARQRFVEQTLAGLRVVPGFESSTISADIPLLAGAGSNTLYARPAAKARRTRGKRLCGLAS